MELLRTCESSRMLLRQRAGEWTGNMVGASGSDAKEILGPSIGSK